MYGEDELVEVCILCDNRWVDAVIVGQPGDYGAFPHDYGVDVAEYRPPPGFLPYACPAWRIRPKRSATDNVSRNAARWSPRRERAC